MLETLALAGLSAGMSALSGIGNAQASAKQGRQQMINDAIAEQKNNDAIANRNAVNARSAAQLLITPENTTETVTKTTRETDDQSNYSYVDVEGMMAAAERAGINPKTWLDAGALGAYTQTGSHRVSGGFSEVKTDTTRMGHNAVAAYQLMSPESALVTASQAQKVPSMLSVIGDAGTAGLNTFNQLNGRQQSQDFQREMLTAQLAARGNLMSSAGKYGGGMAGTPSYSTSGGTSTFGSSNNTGGGASTAAGGLSPTFKDDGDEYLKAWGVLGPQRIEVKNPETVNVHTGWSNDPRWPVSAQSYGDAYSDAIEAIYGTGRYANNALYNAGPRAPTGQRMGVYDWADVFNLGQKTARQMLYDAYNDKKPPVAWPNLPAYGYPQ